mmetsp:Transcript_10594/g.44382  ORF Transcript_10594/g.44382 Transcript_10594/m.44382 type:complete len:206 (+) Transcript_10594:207-824(+)
MIRLDDPLFSRCVATSKCSCMNGSRGVDTTYAKNRTARPRSEFQAFDGALACDPKSAGAQNVALIATPITPIRRTNKGCPHIFLSVRTHKGPMMRRMLENAVHCRMNARASASCVSHVPVAAAAENGRNAEITDQVRSVFRVASGNSHFTSESCRDTTALTLRNKPPTRSYGSVGPHESNGSSSRPVSSSISIFGFAETASRTSK